MINVNQPSEGGNFKRYTGLLTMNVLGVNLTKTELESLKIKCDTEPEYISVSQNEAGQPIAKLRVEFVMGKQVGEGDTAENILVRHSFFLESDYAYTKDKTQVQLIDQFGISRNFDIAEVQAGTFQNEYMDKPSTQVAIVGETDLVKFIRVIASSKKTDVVTLASLTRNQTNKMEIFNDYSYLREVVNHVISANSAPVKVLLGIRRKDDKSYQDVFPFYFGRPYEDGTNFFSRLAGIAKSGGTFMGNRFYGNIDYNATKHSEEQFRLRIFEESEEQTPAASVKIPGLPTGMPAMGAIPTPAAFPAAAPAPAMPQQAPVAAAPVPGVTAPPAPMAAPPMGMPIPQAAQPTPQQQAIANAFTAPPTNLVF